MEGEHLNVQLNHTIVWCRDRQKSSAFLIEVLGLGKPVPFGPMLIVTLGNQVSLDFYESEDKIAQQHYAFLVPDDDFDRVFARIEERGIRYLGGSCQAAPMELYAHNGGRGLYFDDPDGHLLEVMTRPYDLSA